MSARKDQIPGASANNARLALLASQYVAGRLSAAENAELHQLLLSSSAAREQFDRQIVPIRVSNPHVVLFIATEFLERYVPGAKVIALPKTDPEEKADTSALFSESSRTWKAWSLGGALAACIVVALFIAVYGPGRPVRLFNPPNIVDAQPVATLLRAAGVQWLNFTNEVFIGDSFGARELAAAHGVFQLQFNKGARLVVEAPARLQLVSDNEAFLHSGKVTAYVPDEAHGFKVTAPALAVTDLGTEFGVRADGSQAELHVFTGIVEMQRADSARKRMTRGEGARVAGREVQSIIVDRNKFTFEHDVEAMEALEQRGRFEIWRRAAEALSSDAATLVHYTFEGQDPWSGRLSNAVLRAPRSTTALAAGRWGAGRWPEKHGLSFATNTDRIRFAVPNTLTSLTFMAWVRVDRLASLSNALAITESGAVGEMHWQIYKDGRVALSAHSGSTGTVDETWDRGISPPVFTADRLGKWTHLTSVYDSASGATKHYLNGEFISSTPIKHPLPLKLGAVEIGNWGARVDAKARAKPNGSDYFSRSWNGCIDEFALLSRAMDAAEVREYYQRGRVASGMTVATSAR